MKRGVARVLLLVFPIACGTAVHIAPDRTDGPTETLTSTQQPTLELFRRPTSLSA